MKHLWIVFAVGFVIVAIWFFGSGSQTGPVDDRKKAPVNDGWKRIWDLRRAALEEIFGPADEHVLTAIPPFYLDGAADVLTFRRDLNGLTHVTAALIGDETSKPNNLGQYELMICVRKKEVWAPTLISNLARYTRDAVLAPNETMDIGPALPSPTQISSLLFLSYANVNVDGKAATVMLCLGITSDELKFIQEHDVEELVSQLKKANVYPFTDLDRKSVLNP